LKERYLNRYLECNGIAIVTDIVTDIADIVMQDLENKAFAGISVELSIYRYIDDILLAAPKDLILDNRLNFRYI